MYLVHNSMCSINTTPCWIVCFSLNRVGAIGVRREGQGGGEHMPPPPPWKIQNLKKLHGKYKMNKINISQQFIQLEQVTTLGTGIVNILFCTLSKKMSSHVEFRISLPPPPPLPLHFSLRTPMVGACFYFRKYLNRKLINVTSGIFFISVYLYKDLSLLIL